MSASLNIAPGEQIVDREGKASIGFVAKWLRLARGPQKFSNVSGLPTKAHSGDLAYAEDLRVFNGTGTQESAGVGTGGLVTFNGTNWVIAGTNVTAVA